MLNLSVVGQMESAFRYAASISHTELKKHLYVLASDSLEGRETGKPGMQKAANYIASEFRKYGIPPYNGSYFQTFSVEEKKPYGVKIQGGKNAFAFLSDFYFLPGFNDQVVESKNILFIGYGIADETYNDYLRTDVKDKVVMMIDGEPLSANGISLITGTDKVSAWSKNRRKKIELAREAGAKAIFVIDEHFTENLLRLGHLITTPTMVLEGTPEDPKAPAFYISPSMANHLLGKNYEELKYLILVGGKPVKRKAKVSLKIDVTRRKNVLQSHNVIGYLEGKSKKDELIVITAHFDHLGIQDGKTFFGADDDASGTSAVISLAKAFSDARKAGNGPERSILFMPVSGEEKGLLGSKYYTEHPLFPLDKTVANLNIDMIGRVDSLHTNGNYTYIIGGELMSKELQQVSDSVNKACCKLELDYRYNSLNDPNRFFYRSDHYNFVKHKVPVIFYFNGIHSDYHQPTDTKEKIDFNKMEKITNLIFFTAWDLANRPNRVKLNTDVGK